MLIIDRVIDIVDICMKFMTVREDLVQIVEMGPFKHRIDNGLDVRKSAYEIIYSLSGSSQLLSKVDQSQLLRIAINALNDPAEEIQSISHLLLTRLSKVGTTDFTALQEESVMTALTTKMKSIITVTAKDNSVKQEIEKQSEMALNALKSLLVFSNGIGVVGELERSAGDGGQVSLKTATSLAPHLVPLQTLWQELLANVKVAALLAQI